MAWLLQIKEEALDREKNDWASEHQQIVEEAGWLWIAEKRRYNDEGGSRYFYSQLRSVATGDDLDEDRSLTGMFSNEVRVVKKLGDA